MLPTGSSGPTGRRSGTRAWRPSGRASRASGSTTTSSPTRATGTTRSSRAGRRLAALAPLTTTARLGLLVAANTFRNPGLTAKLATTLDHLSGGRFILGIGGGWFGREHEAFGLDFGSGFGERLDRLEEAVDLIERLLAGERVTHEGRFYRFADALCEPRPVQARLPILIGGSGREKTLRTTARHADLWNGYGEPARIAETSAVLRERCEEIGRPFESIERTVTMEVVIRASESEAREAYAVIEDRHGIRGRIGSDGTPRGLNVGGPPEVVADYVRAVRGARRRRGHLDLPQPVRPRDDVPPRRGPRRARLTARVPADRAVRSTRAGSTAPSSRRCARPALRCGAWPGKKIGDRVFTLRYKFFDQQIGVVLAGRDVARRRHPVDARSGARDRRGPPRADPRSGDGRRRHALALRPRVRQQRLPAGLDLGPRPHGRHPPGPRPGDDRASRRRGSRRSPRTSARPRSTRPTGRSMIGRRSSSAIGSSSCSISAGRTPTRTSSITVPDADVLFAGDLVEGQAPPSFGDSYPLDWPAALERMLPLVTGRVVPGHGDVGGRAFVEEQLDGFRELVDLARRVHAGDVEPRCREAGRDVARRADGRRVRTGARAAQRRARLTLEAPESASNVQDFSPRGKERPRGPEVPPTRGGPAPRGLARLGT